MSEQIKDAIVRFASMTTHKAPVFTEEKIGSIVKYGDDINYPYPDYLVRLYQSSPKHSAIINAKVRYAIGGGWYANGNELNKQQQAIAQKIIYNTNPNESLNEVTNKSDKDWNIFGGVALEVIWNNAGTDFDLYHIDFGKVRVFYVGEGKDKKQKFAYLDDWKGIIDIHRAKDKPSYKEWYYFGTNNKGSELIYWKDHKPVKSGEIDAYPLPSYVAAIGYIEADSEIQNFHINNIKNNFWGGQIVTLTNVFQTEEAQKRFVKDFKAKKTGTDNTGETMFVFANSDAQKVETTPLQPSDLDKQFDILNKTVRDEIFTAHNITTPTLFGIRIEGSLGNRSEMMDGYEIFYATFIQPHQQEWESIINWIYSYKGIGNIFKLKAIKPLTFQLSESVITQVLSKEKLEQLVSEQLGIDLSNKVIQFSEHKTDDILSRFSEMGIIVDDADIVYSARRESEKTEFKYKQEYFASVLETEIGEDEVDILSLIKQDKTITSEEIADILGLTKKEVNTITDNLYETGLLKGKIGSNAGISKQGGELLKDDDIVLDLEVMYRYALIPNIPKAESGSRPFCVEMMALSKSGKVYSKSEIELITNDIGENAWDYRGGFYTNPNTGKTTPQCRHMWESVLIKRKRK